MSDLGDFSGAYLQGYEFHRVFFGPDGDPVDDTLDPFDLLAYSPYKITDFSPAAGAFWAGFHDATQARVARKRSE